MIEILYSIAGTIAIVASSAQIVQLYRSGRSDELSVMTWALWAATQLVSFLYAVSLRASLLMLFNALWVLFYAIMVGLILYYRKYPRAEVKPIEVAGEVH